MSGKLTIAGEVTISHGTLQKHLGHEVAIAEFDGDRSAKPEGIELYCEGCNESIFQCEPDPGEAVDQAYEKGKDREMAAAETRPQPVLDEMGEIGFGSE